MIPCWTFDMTNRAFGRFALLAVACLALSACRRNEEIDTREKCANAISAGKYDKALPMLKAEVDKSPRDASLMQLLGLAYWKVNQVDKAVECFEAAQRLLPGNLEPAEYRGYIEMQAKRWSRAEEALSRVLTASPRNVRALTAMAVVRLGTNNVQSAQAYLKEALRLEPNYPPALYNLAWLHYYKRQVPADSAPIYKQYLTVADDEVRAAKAQSVLRRIQDVTIQKKPVERTTSRKPTAQKRGR